MKNKKFYIILFLIIIVLLPLGYFLKKKLYDPQKRLSEWSERTKTFLSDGSLKEGDILFQETNSKQSKAIQLATHSEWNHIGIVFKDTEGFFVYEAVQPVKKTPLANWFARGIGNKFVIKRLIDSEKILNEENLFEMKKFATKLLDKNYDIYFEWSDERMYCSEYVWKVYKEVTGVEVGKIQKLKEFDLTSEEVKKIMNERYGDKPPFDETVISPAAIFNSDKLKTVLESNN